MQIRLDDIIKKYGRPTGIIHVGAHLAQERNSYLRNNLDNTIWIEANPEVYDKINFINELKGKEKVFNLAISNSDNEVVNFNITNNGQSSSILELEKCKILYPQIEVVKQIEVKTKRLDTLIKEESIDLSIYNFLNLDIQGAELLAIQGMGLFIENMKYIYTEVNTSHIYKNCALIEEIDEYLENYKFTRVETSMTKYEWGDALYMKL